MEHEMPPEVLAAEPAPRSRRVLTELATEPRVAIFETQRDLAGYRRPLDRLDRPVVEHFLEARYETMVALWQDCLRGNLPAQERGARLTVRLEGR